MMDAGGKDYLAWKGNEVLKTFEPHLRFGHSARGRLTLTMEARPPIRARTKLAQVSPHSGSLCFRYGDLGMGGTAAMAVGQLVRWIRGQTRLPLASWEYWATDKIRLTNAQTIEALKRHGYDDPAKTCCVLCGSRKVNDWWNHDGKTGPCCQWNRCLDRPKVP